MVTHGAVINDDGGLVKTLSRDTINARFGLKQAPPARMQLPVRRSSAASHLFYEDFESVTGRPPYALPNGWTTQATPNHPTDKWIAATLGTEGGNGKPLPGTSGYKYALTLQAANDFTSNSWMFSPGFQLEAGKSYDIVFYYYTPENSQTKKYSDFTVSLGTAASADAMDDQIFKNDGNTYNWTVVRRTVTPETGGTYYLGFHSFSTAGSYLVAIDDVSVDEAGPRFEHNGLVDFGTVKQGTKATASTFVYNIGSKPLTISSVDAPEGLTVGNVPRTIAPAEQGNYYAELPLTLNTANLPVGNDTTAFTLHTNDPYHATAAVPYAVNIIETRTTGYWLETFENGYPDQWDMGSAAAVYSKDGLDDGHCLGDWAITDNAFSTHEIRVGNNPHVSFWYKVRKYDLLGEGEAAMDPSGVGIIVSVSEDQGETFKEVYSILPEGGSMKHVKSLDYAKVDFALPDEYKNKTCIFKFAVKSSGDWNNSSEYLFDDMAFGTAPQTDLAVSSFHGTAYPTVGQKGDYVVSVANKSVKAAADWKVSLMNADTKAVLATVAGPSLQPGSTCTVTLQWAPTKVGAKNIYAVATLAGDEKLSNDTTAVFPVHAINGQTTAINTGYFDAKDLLAEKAPVDFYDYNSMSQTLYTANELGIAKGSIKGIQYRAKSITEVSPSPLQFYIGEVSDDDLSSGKFIDMSKLTKVYDAAPYIPKGESVVDIPFATPFEYHGGNIVVCAVRNAPTFFYSTNFLSKDKYSTVRTLIYGDDQKPVSVDSLPTDDITTRKILPVANFIVDRGGELGAVKGRVTTSGNKALTGATVALVGTKLTTTTDWDGQYSFPTLAAGTYTLKAISHGYADGKATSIVTKANTTTTDFILQPLPTCTISGTVKGIGGKALEGVLVKVKGYDKFHATTDASGHYSIADVYGGTDFNYAVEASAPYYNTATDSIHGLRSDLSHDFTLSPIRSAVSGVTAREESNKAYVEWEQPNFECRYDDGNIVDQIGYNNYGYRAIIGTVYRRAVKINKLQWYLTSESGPHPTVNLFVFTLDKNGEPTDTLLTSARDITNIDGKWNTFELPDPVTAPRGFYFAVSTSSGFTALAKTSVSENHPYLPHVYYASTDYTLDVTGKDIQKFKDITDSYPQQYHLALRAQGDDYGPVDYDFATQFSATTISALRPTPQYNVYRALTTDKKNLTTLAEGLSETDYTDDAYGTIADGKYTYAVIPVYDGVLSDTTFSNKVVKGLYVTVNIQTDREELLATANLRLNNIDKTVDYDTYVFNASISDTKVVIPHVDNGRYVMHVEVPGFKEVVDTIFVTDEERVFDVALQEFITMPRTLTAAESDDDGNISLSWTHGALFDDFEGYDDFTANHIGDYTVKLNNSDQVFGISEVDFDNEYAATPYIVFNPYATTPAMAAISYYRVNSEPWSGRKYLAVMSQSTDADSWFILPQTAIENGDELSFYVKSVTPYRVASSFEIGVAATGDADNITRLRGTAQDAPYDWTLCHYDLSQYAGKTVRVAIHNTQVSSAFMLMIDDLYLGAADARGQHTAPNGFNIYLDNDRVASQVEGYTYQLQHVAMGKHRVGVSAVYGNNESDIRWISINVTATGISTVTTDNKDSLPKYNLAGQRVNDSYKGVVICGGKKYVRK